MEPINIKLCEEMAVTVTHTKQVADVGNRGQNFSLQHDTNTFRQKIKTAQFYDRANI